MESASVHRDKGFKAPARHAASVALLLLLAIPKPALADSSDRALAEQLFRTGQELMSQHRYAEACPKLAESQRLDPGTGTLLNLAVCHEQEGKLASAWSEFNDAATFARRDQRPDRVQYAEQRIAQLETKLSRLTIELAKDGDTPGLEIRLDGDVIGRPALGVAAPIDPGSHTLSASAPGRRAWQTKLEVPAGAAQQTVLIPKLTDAPAEPKREGSGVGAAGSPTPENSGKSQRVGAYVLGGLGIVGVAAGSFFGLRAISQNQKSNQDGCNGNVCPSPAAETRRSAVSNGKLSTVLFAAGGAALAGGVVLYLTAPRTHVDAVETTPRATLSLRPGIASLELGGAW